MIWSRSLLKVVHWRMWPTNIRRIAAQLPRIGAVYSEKLANSGIKTLTDILAMTPQELKQVLGRASDSICEAIRVIPCYHLSVEKVMNALRIVVRNTGGFEPDSKSGTDPAYDIIAGIAETNKVLLHTTITTWPADKIVSVECPLPPGVDPLAVVVHGIDSRFIGLDKTGRLFLDSDSDF
jgi:hypothetical protein